MALAVAVAVAVAAVVVVVVLLVVVVVLVVVKRHILKPNLIVSLIRSVIIRELLASVELGSVLQPRSQVCSRPKHHPNKLNLIIF